MKRYDTDAINSGEMLEASDGYYVEFTEAQAEIDSRDKRITELEAQLLEAKADTVRLDYVAREWFREDPSYGLMYSFTEDTCHGRPGENIRQVVDGERS